MKQHIYQLELSLLEPSVRQSLPKLNTLIADEFTEFGISGNIYNKRNILDSLPLETLKELSDPQKIIEGLTVTELSTDVALVTYRLRINSIISLRSSIWKQKDGTWQMLFHQGTKCENEV